MPNTDNKKNNVMTKGQQIWAISIPSLPNLARSKNLIGQYTSIGEVALISND